MQKEFKTGALNSTPIEWVRSPLTITKSALALFVIDRMLKLWAFTHPLQTIALAGKFVTFTLFLNFNVTFGIPLLWNAWFSAFMSITIILLIGIRVRSITFRRMQQVFALDILILGAISNFMDRVTQPNAVIDYLHLWPWSYINIADIMILLGIYLLYIHHYGRNSRTTRA